MAKAKTVEEIWAYTIGELRPLTLLRDYDPSWPESFEREAARIRSVLGARVSFAVPSPTEDRPFVSRSKHTKGTSALVSGAH